MFRIQRTKKHPGLVFGPPAVHYAVAVAPAGNITAWTADPDAAALVPVEVCQKVQAFYHGKPHVGDLACLPDRPEPVLVEESKPVEPVMQAVAEVKPEPKKSKADYYKPRRKEQGD